MASSGDNILEGDTFQVGQNNRPISDVAAKSKNQQTKFYLEDKK